MGIPTAESLRLVHRRLARRTAAKRRHGLTADTILEAMRQGASLHRCYRTDRIIWALSTGEFVTHEAATDVISDRRVVGVGDSLFSPELSQTFRYAED
jgi:hypothetical protein